MYFAGTPKGFGQFTEWSSGVIEIDVDNAFVICAIFTTIILGEVSLGKAIRSSADKWGRFLGEISSSSKVAYESLSTIFLT